MPYTPYLSLEEFDTKLISQDDKLTYLSKAHRHIDSLTFNRIVGKFDRLTEFQREIVKEVCSRLAEFEYENEAMLNSVVKGYSINGVSAEFGGVNLKFINGIAIPNELYQTLTQTGLCCRSFRVRL